MKQSLSREDVLAQIVNLTPLVGTSSIASAGLVSSGIPATVPGAASLTIRTLSLTLVPAPADGFLGEARNRFLGLGTSHVA